MIDKEPKPHQNNVDSDDHFTDEDAERYFAELPDDTDESKETELTNHYPFVTILVICMMIVFLGIAVNVLIVKHFSNHNAHRTAVKATEQSAEDSSDKVLRVSRPSVVLITADSMTTSGGVQTIKRSSGSGVILSEDGTIVTCEHVISEASSISVHTVDNQVYWANVVGIDIDNDIAVIKINASGLTAATMGRVDYSLIGKKIFAIGNPGVSLSDTVAEGILYTTSQKANVEGRKLKLMLSTAQIAPGFSGGGLFTADGKLVGMIDAGASYKDMDGSRFCCSISVNRVVAVVNRLLKTENEDV